jgi:hypothetical protein
LPEEREGWYNIKGRGAHDASLQQGSNLMHDIASSTSAQGWGKHFKTIGISSELGVAAKFAPIELSDGSAVIVRAIKEKEATARYAVALVRRKGREEHPLPLSEWAQHEREIKEIERIFTRADSRIRRPDSDEENRLLLLQGGVTLAP